MADGHDAYDPDPRIAHMAAEIHSLRRLVESIIEELPERAIKHISGALDWSVSTARTQADLRDTDPSRDFADRLYEIGGEIREHCVEAERAVAEGERIRTVQPAPIRLEDEWPSV